VKMGVRLRRQLLGTNRVVLSQQRTKVIKLTE